MINPVKLSDYQAYCNQTEKNGLSKSVNIFNLKTCQPSSITRVEVLKSFKHTLKEFEITQKSLPFRKEDAKAVISLTKPVSTEMTNAQSITTLPYKNIRSSKKKMTIRYDTISSNQPSEGLCLVLDS